MTFFLSGKCLFILLLILIETLAVPHLPQVVYPSKDRARTQAPTKSDGISRGKATTKNAGHTLMSKRAQRPPQQQGVPQQNAPNQQQQGVPQQSAPNQQQSIPQQNVPNQQSLPQQQHQSGYTATTKQFQPNFDHKQTNNGQNESRVVLAPIEGEKVYTLDRFPTSKLNRTLVSPIKSNRPKTALAAAKTTQLSKGISLVNEVILAPDQKRTTMSEATERTTTTANLSSSSTTTAQPPTNQTNAQNPTTKSSQKTTQTSKTQLLKDPALSLRNVRLVSHDTSSGHASSELRYPAQKWQLPPSLYLARQNQHAHDLETNSVKTGDYVGNSAAEEQADGSYEEALELYMKSQGLPAPPKNLKVPARGNGSSNKQDGLGSNRGEKGYYQKQKLNEQPSTIGPLNPMQTLQHVAKSIDDLVEKTFGEKKTRPKMTYISGDNKKFRATFATHHDGKEAIPLPTGPFPDETDMDLLIENTRRPGTPPASVAAHSTSHFGPHSGSNFGPHPGSNFGPQSVGHHGSPQSSVHRPVPIQQSPAQTTYRPLDPNYKLDLCCRKQQVGPVCQQMCNFDTFTDRSLISAVLSNQCPGPQLGQAFDCASSKADHTDCCTRNNLHLYAGGQCMPFCRTHQPTPPNLISYIACLQVFDTIKNCYREHSYTHPNIFGD